MEAIRAITNKFIFNEFIEIYSVTSENTISKPGRFYQKKYKLKPRDSIVASTAVINNATLFSGDNAFSKIFNLKFN